MDLFDYNVPDRVNDFVSAALSQVRHRAFYLDVYEFITSSTVWVVSQSFICSNILFKESPNLSRIMYILVSLFQANITRTNHIMWTMGTDFKYQYAHTWFRQMDKFINYVNQVSSRTTAFFVISIASYLKTCFIFCANGLTGLHGCRMGVSMPCTQPHQYILMPNTQQMSHGRSRVMTSFREFKFFRFKVTNRYPFLFLFVDQ